VVGAATSPQSEALLAEAEREFDALGDDWGHAMVAFIRMETATAARLLGRARLREDYDRPATAQETATAARVEAASRLKMGDVAYAEAESESAKEGVGTVP
jgi:hypothetical protein